MHDADMPAAASDAATVFPSGVWRPCAKPSANRRVAMFKADAIFCGSCVRVSKNISTPANCGIPSIFDGIVRAIWILPTTLSGPLAVQTSSVGKA
jgi:hypothetical protein